MKTSTILFLVGSAVIIGGGALAFNIVTKPDSAVVVPMAKDSLDVATTTESDTVTGSASILGLMNGVKGKNTECTFVFTGNSSRSEGTGFFIDGQARVDMLYNDEKSKQIASYMIMDIRADTMYVWTLVDGEQTGMKMSISENEKMATKLKNYTPAKTSPVAQQISPDSDVQYTCKPWSPDATVFVPPADVAFTDMSDMNKMMGDMMEGTKIPMQ